MAQVITPTRQQSNNSKALAPCSSHVATDTQSGDRVNASPVSNSIVTTPHLSPSSRPYTFTPQRVQSLPRAWERRPATPYVPRNDAQRIWKRVPLAVIDLNDGQSWRKGQQPADRRSVKRLRVSQPCEEDKENDHYITSKWDEDGMVTNSPKRKAVSYDGAADTDEETPTDKQEETSPETDDDSDNEEYAEDEEDLPDQSIPEESENGPAGSPVTEATSSMLDNESYSQTEEALPVSSRLIPECTDDTFSNPGTFPKAIPPTATPLTGTAQPPTAQEGEAQARSDGANVAQPSEVYNFPIDHDDFPFLQNFLSRSQAKKAVKLEAPQQDGQAPIGPTELAEQSSGESTLVRIENEDAIADAMSAPPEDVKDPAATTTLCDEDGAILEPDQDADTNMTSPCRRSSRLNTKLARPRKPATTLPSSIPLKRLNGTEFIATQREAQSVAVATRTNTKRNKGPALSVKARLVQLRAETKVWGANLPIGELQNPPQKKVFKNVTWSGILARFEDGSTVQDSLDEEGVGEELDKPETSAENAQPDQPKPDEVEEPAQVEEKPARKVRKLRKLNAGTFNGTPAPERTTSIPVPVATAFSEKMSESAAKEKGSAAIEAKAVVGEKLVQTRPKRRLSKISDDGHRPLTT